jgi:pimeloyl-ACP methyl ester carboxylesterase
LVEHAEGFAEFSNSPFGSSVSQRWAARFRATPAMLELAVRHRVPIRSADKHFTFQYELPKAPLQKREAKTSNPYTRKQVRGRPMTLAHTPTSRQLEADVRELNEFLDRQQIEGGVHQGYIRIFQNGDAAGFNWNYGGRLYSQPSASNYQQMSKKARLKMTFNGEPVAEIDIRASYLTLFYGWFGRQLDFNSDPYLLPGFGKAGRDAVKLWMVATFGSARPINKWPTSLLKEYEDDHGKKLDRTRYAVKLVREKALLQHPLMARWGEPRNGRVRTWADLMYYESVVMVSTMVALMRDHGIPSLAVHDSLIVPQSAKFSPIPAFFGADFRKTDGAARGCLGASAQQGLFQDEVAIVRDLVIPLAILHGAAEQIVDLDYLRRLTAPTLWRQEVQVIDNAGHTLQWEQPQAFDKLLDAFASSL